MHKTDILDVVSRKLAPFILLFGLYLITYGHVTPGGGFQGGVVLASGMVLLLLCRGTGKMQTLFPIPAIHFVEALGFFAFLVMGLAGVIAGNGYLSNFLPAGRVETVPGAGFIFILNIIIGLKVGAGITLICYFLFKEDES